MPTTTKAKASPQTPRQRELEATQARAQRVREELRREVCVAPKYPGKPEEYKYVPQHCVKKGQGSAVRVTGGIPLADTRREIRLLQKAIDAYGKHHRDADIEGTNIDLMMGVFARMLDSKDRKNHPDPIERYSALVDKITKELHHDSIVVPRYTVLTLTMNALRKTHGL